MAKKPKAKRSTAKRLLGQRAPTKLQHGRAAKMAALFIDEIQRIVDEQTERDLGLKPRPAKEAAAFRARVTGMIAKAAPATGAKGRKRG